MSIGVSEKQMTAEEFLALPDDGTERMLLRGRLWEKPMTKRNRWHCRVENRIGQLISNWLDSVGRPIGEVYSGEAGFRLSSDTVVGIDVAYADHSVATRDSDETTMLEGSPILAVEILSPNDKQDEINAKIDDYLAAGVRFVWIVDTHFETVVVHQPGQTPEMFAGDEELVCEPEMPGFRVKARHIFNRFKN